MNDMYDKNICIEFNGHTYTTAFDAVSYNALIAFIKTIEYVKQLNHLFIRLTFVMADIIEHCRQ